MKKLPKLYLMRRISDYVSAGVLVLVLVFIWQLYRAPISVQFLKPYIMAALGHNEGYTVTLDEVNLELVRSIMPVKIIAKNIKYKKNDDSIIIQAPKTSVNFSLKALLRGVVAPSSIKTYRPKVYVFNKYGVDKEQKESIGKKKLEYYFDEFENFIERFNSADNSYVESYINEIEIADAEVEFHEVDLGKKIAFSELDYHFKRSFSNITSHFDGTLEGNTQKSPFGFNLEYRLTDNKVALQFYSENFVPAEMLNNLISEETAKKLYQINTPMGGKIEFLLNLTEAAKYKADLLSGLDKIVETTRFSLNGGEGYVAFNNDAEYNYQIKGLSLAGTLEGGLDKLKIDDAELNLGEQKAKIGLKVSGLKNLLLQDDVKDFKATMVSEIEELKIDDLSQYWPKYINEKAWMWCEESLHSGIMQNARFVFDMEYNAKSGQIALKKLDGKGYLSGVSLFYLTGMPNVDDIHGNIYFYNEGLKIDADRGVSANVNLTGGYVRLYGFDQDDQFADINLVLSGKIPDVLRLIDNKPLGFAKEMGLNPEAIKGETKTDLSLNFELKNNLTPQEVDVDVKSEISNLQMPKMIGNKDLFAQKVELKVNNEGLYLEGDAELGSLPMHLIWDQEFADKAYKSKYQIGFVFDEKFKKDMDIDFSVLKNPYVVGNPYINAKVFSYHNGKMEIKLDADMTNSKMDFAFLGVKKPQGEKASVLLEAVMQNDKLQEIKSFGFKQTDFELSGKISLDKNNKVKEIIVDEIKGNKTDAKAKVEFAQENGKPKIKVNISGTEYNLIKLFEKDEEAIAARKLAKKQGKYTISRDNDFENVMNADINIAVNKLWSNKEVALKNFAGTAKLVNGFGLYEAHMVGNLGQNSDASLKFDYIPRNNNEFSLYIESADAGAALKVLNLYENMRGGLLRIEGKKTADKEIVGHALIRDAKLYNTPVLAKLLTVASLKSMLSLLTGEGLVFSHIDLPFEYRNKILFAKESKAIGNSMAITANGSYDRAYEDYDVKGVIVPVRGLNNLISSIPLVGQMLTGKDGTVFAMDYSIVGDADEPSININPLSVLSPSSIKDLFATD